MFGRYSFTTDIDIGVGSIISSRYRAVHDDFPGSMTQEDGFDGFEISYDVVGKAFLCQQQIFHINKLLVKKRQIIHALISQIYPTEKEVPNQAPVSVKTPALTALARPEYSDAASEHIK
jgi:hypothetical protein